MILDCDRFAIICNLKAKAECIPQRLSQLIPQLCLDSKGTKQLSADRTVGQVILVGYCYPHWP